MDLIRHHSLRPLHSSRAIPEASSLRLNSRCSSYGLLNAVQIMLILRWTSWLSSPLRLRLANPLKMILHFLMASSTWNLIPAALNSSRPSVLETMVSGASKHVVTDRIQLAKKNYQDHSFLTYKLNNIDLKTQNFEQFWT